MDKQIKISETLYNGLILLLEALESENVSEKAKILISLLQAQIDIKEAAINRRVSFTAFKDTEPGSTKREEMRSRYLAESTEA
jgi:hypothetical protein